VRATNIELSPVVHSKTVLPVELINLRHSKRHKYCILTVFFGEVTEIGDDSIFFKRLYI